MGRITEVVVPDIGDFGEVPIIEIAVAPGDSVNPEDPLITLESDKASMDVPAPEAGVVKELKVALGDAVSEGSLILTLEVTAGAGEVTAGAGAPATSTTPTAAAATLTDPDIAPPPPPSAPEPAPQAQVGTTPDPRAPSARPAPTASLSAGDERPKSNAHATPAVRRFARELGVELGRVTGTGRKGRILKDDVTRYVKGELGKPQGAGTATGIPPMPAVDFAKFGEIETRPLPRIKKISGPHLHRAWLNVPHVTHHDEADVTELEDFRKSLKDEADKRGVRVTMLAFIMKGLVASLKKFPQFNASLTPDGESLVFKKYFHVGVAVDTPNGLVVPVFRDVDQKGIFELATEMAELSARARDGKLKPNEMQGGCMSISSLGGIGGTAFTPIVNAPEVAILGVTRGKMAPVWNGQEFIPRLMLPLDLSYDHRVIDGADAARFTAYLCQVMGDLRRLLL